MSSFMSDEHDELEDALIEFRKVVGDELGISDALSGRWHAHFDGLVEFVSLTEQTYWQAIYGREVTEEICDAILGRSLRIELLRPRSMRRRIIIAGGVGSGRPGVGDAIRRLVIECLVRSSQFGSPSASSMNVLLSTGHDQTEAEIFGGRRTGMADPMPGCLTSCANSVLFLDGIFNLPENQQRRLLAHLEPMGAGLYRHLPEAAQLHLISGIDSEFGELRNDRASIHRVLFEVLCRDGLIRLPALKDRLDSATSWSRIFKLVFNQVASEYCGLPHINLHRYGSEIEQTGHDDIPTDLIADEQSQFIEWVTQPQKVEEITEIYWEVVKHHDWHGNLRELEALIRRTIDLQLDGVSDRDVMAAECNRFVRRGRHDSANHQVPNTWLNQFSSDLPSLPLTDGSLPNVIHSVEATYLKEAAKQAARMRKPNPARIQDVARILGIPRQTAARKWQYYQLSASLLATPMDD